MPPLPRKSLAKRKTIGGHVLTKVLPTIVASDNMTDSSSLAQTVSTSALSSEVVDADGFQFTRKKQKVSSSHTSQAGSMAVPLNDTLATNESMKGVPLAKKSLAVKVVNFDMPSEPDHCSLSAHPAAMKRMTYASSLSRRRSSVALRSFRPTLLPTSGPIPTDSLSQDPAALPAVTLALSAPSLAHHSPVGMPHATIPVSDYHKYLAAELPGPLRLKQLLLWGFHGTMAKAANDVPATASDASSVLVQQVLQETFDSLQTNEFSVSWYQRDTTSESSRALKPHPRDEEARALIDQYESMIARIEQEMKEWEAILSSVKSVDVDTAEPIMAPDCEMTAVCESLAARVSETERELAGWNKGLLEIDSWMQSFEFKVDQLQNALKVSANLERHAKSVCESTFHQIVQHVFTRRENALVPMDPLTVLRSLSRTNVASS